MTDLFGSHGIINPLTMLVCGLGALLCFILRKAINDAADMGFSIIGSIGGLSLAYIIVSVFLPFKWALLAGVLGLFGGGFGLAGIFGDGEASG